MVEKNTEQCTCFMTLRTYLTNPDAMLLPAFATLFNVCYFFTYHFATTHILFLLHQSGLDVYANVNLLSTILFQSINLKINNTTIGYVCYRLEVMLSGR